MHQLVIETERAWQSLGRISYGASGSGKRNPWCSAASLYVVKDMQAGEAFSAENAGNSAGSVCRPKLSETVIGKHARTALKRGNCAGFGGYYFMRVAG